MVLHPVATRISRFRYVTCATRQAHVIIPNKYRMSRLKLPALHHLGVRGSIAQRQRLGTSRRPDEVAAADQFVREHGAADGRTEGRRLEGGGLARTDLHARERRR